MALPADQPDEVRAPGFGAPRLLPGAGGARSFADLPPHPREVRHPVPATGAWQEGDPVGRRRFHHLALDHPFALEGGGALDHITVAYETWGHLDDEASNAVLLCHALTGDAHAAGRIETGHPTAGWWDDLVGPGRAFDTDRHFVVCANVLGGCQGTTGPASLDPLTGRPYGSRFPVVTIRDMVRTQASLADALGIDRWLLVAGGSMGGMQVIEWAIMYPHRVRAICAMASTLEATAEQIAWSAAGRTALALDPRWRGGDYYEAEPGDGPHVGLAVARSIAQITYRSDQVFTERFHRDLVDSRSVFGLWDRFQIESYLDYHGLKLARRFDANSYVLLNRAMDLHDVGRGRGGVDAALARVEADALVTSISSDRLYPPRLQQDMVDGLRRAGVDCEYHVVDSPQGHDGFLLESEAHTELIRSFLDRVEDSDGRP